MHCGGASQLAESISRRREISAKYTCLRCAAVDSAGDIPPSRRTATLAGRFALLIASSSPVSPRTGKRPRRPIRSIQPPPAPSSSAAIAGRNLARRRRVRPTVSNMQLRAAAGWQDVRDFGGRRLARASAAQPNEARGARAASCHSVPVCSGCCCCVYNTTQLATLAPIDDEPTGVVRCSRQLCLRGIS